MGIELYCVKKVKDRAEQMYWALTLDEGGSPTTRLRFDPKNGLFHFDTKTKELMWCGWSLKVLPNSGNPYDPTDFIRPGKSGRSVSKRKLEHNLKLWGSDYDHILDVFDKHSYWTLG